MANFLTRVNSSIVRQSAWLPSKSVSVILSPTLGVNNIFLGRCPYSAASEKEWVGHQVANFFKKTVNAAVCVHCSGMNSTIACDIFTPSSF